MPGLPITAAYQDAVFVLGGQCPVESGFSYLADHECVHGDLPTPKYPFPQCGCWPRNQEERDALRMSGPVAAGSPPLKPAPDLIAAFRSAEDFWRLRHPDRIRVVMWMVDGRHKSHSEVARTFGISRSSVEKMVASARRQRQGAIA